MINFWNMENSVESDARWQKLQRVPQQKIVKNVAYLRVSKRLLCYRLHDLLTIFSAEHSCWTSAGAEGTYNQIITCRQKQEILTLVVEGKPANLSTIQKQEMEGSLNVQRLWAGLMFYEFIKRLNKSIEEVSVGVWTRYS